MIELLLFIRIFFSLLAGAAKPIGLLFFLVFLLGNALWVFGYPANSYMESLGISFSTFLNLGSPDHAKFPGGLRIIELPINILGLILVAILTAAAIKALERGMKGK
jgi:hypothetical protein